MDQLAAGSTLGPYVIVAPLGAGGMGHVYRAHDARLDRDVAIKVLSPALSTDDQALGRLRREAKTIAALSHPNILSIFDVNLENEPGYLVTELLEGRTLREVLDEGPIEEHRVRSLGAEAAAAVGAAHSRGVIHRDLKPENIFLTEDGQLKILDFGLARSSEPAGRQSQIETQSFFTEDGVILGTVGYMSPEQVRAEPAGPPSDVFALGCLLYEMLSGSPPFQRRTPMATLTAILHDDPAPLPATVSASLRRTVSRCLRKKPGERFRSGGELAQALRANGASAVLGMRWLLPAAALAAVAATALLLWPRQAPLEKELAKTTPEVSQSQGQRLIVMLPVASGTPAPDPHVIEQIQEEVERGLQHRGSVRLLPPASTESLAHNENAEELLEGLGVDTILALTVSGSAESLVVDASVETMGGPRHSVSFSAADPASAGEIMLAEISQLLSLESVPATRPISKVPEARDLYYEAQHHWSRRGSEGVGRAIELLQKAIDLDPQFALAYAGLADAYAVLHNASSLPTSETFPRARAAALKAVQIDPDLPEAQISLGYIAHYYDLDYQEAERRYQKAIEMRPDSATAHQWYAELLAVTGREQEARQQIDRALELDPLSPIIGATAVWLELMMHDYDRALERGRAAMLSNPSDPRALAYLGRVMVEREQYEQAVALHRKAVELSNSPIMELWLAEALARSGSVAEAKALIEDVASRPTYVNPYYLAFPYIALGDHEKALALLEEAFESKVEQRVWMRADPSLDPLRASEAFQTMIRRVPVG